jgi:hypothetical protein
VRPDRGAALLVLGALVAQPAPARAERTHVRTTGPTELVRPDGARRALPPGRFLDEATFGALDLEMRRLQEAETRLAAENRSLRESARGWRPGWKLLLGAAIAGAAAGAYGALRLD